MVGNYYRNSTRTTRDMDPDSTSTCYSEYYLTTYTAEEKPTEDEKAARIKAEEEEKRVRHMRELWKLDRKFGKNRNGTRMIR